MQGSKASGHGTTLLPACRFKKKVWESFEDTVSVEIALQVSWKDTLRQQEGKATLWAWPQDLAPLALGHVLLDICPGENILERKVQVEENSENNFSVILGDRQNCSYPEAPATISASSLLQAMHSFISAEGHWESTGCFHRAGLYDPVAEKLLVRTEDIGRHNCLDRIAGWGALSSTPVSDKVLLTSARITASLCAKAIRAGFRVMVSRSAVTSASIALAIENGVTLVGFARTDEERFSVFADEAARIYEKEKKA